MLTILMLGFVAAPLSAQDCSPITVSDDTSWFEDFESYAGSGEQPFQCWIALVTDATYNGPFVYCGWGASCHSGQNSAEMKGASNLLVLPDFTNDITDLRLTFWATATNTSVGTLEVGVITDTTDEASFVSLFTCGTPGPRGGASAGNGNLMGPFDFNAATVMGRIALRYTSTSASQSWNLDDFTVSLIPACAEPSGLATNNVTAYSADLAWNEVSGNTYDLLYWIANGDTSIVSGASLNDGVYTLNSLTPNTAYGWTMRTDCGDGSYAYAFNSLSFLTPNIPVELPYEMNFETDPESITDFTLQSTNTNHWFIGPATFKPEDPTDETETGYSLYISNDNSSYAYSHGSYESWYSYAILDAQFPTDAVEWHLAFDYKVQGYEYEYYSYEYYNDFLSVYIVDGDATMPTSGMPSGTALMGMTLGVTDWTHADFILPNVAGTAKKIVFVWKNYSYGNGTNPAAIDNIEIFFNACAQPSNLAVTDVTSDEATLTWVENGTATDWTVYWKEVGSEDDYFTESANDTAVTLYNLTPNTYYEFYVVAGCNSNPTPIFTFHTLSVPVELPYERTFEEGDDNPVTEITLQGTGDNQWAIGTATFNPDADDPTAEGHSLYISNDNGVTNNYNTSNTSYAYAILNVSFDESLEYHLAFDYKTMGEGGSYAIYDYLSVYLMDASAEVPTNVVPSGTALLSQKYNVGDWTHADFLLENVAGTSKKIVFFWKNDGTSGTNPPAAIDNISIQGFTCAQPSNLTASNITSSSATLNWQENGSATAWNVYYRPVGGSEWSMETATDESLDITGLGGNTKYEFYVTADCSGEESNPSATAEFRTLCGDEGISVLPFSEDFEGEPVDGYVVCWTRSTSDSTGSHQVYLNTTDAYYYGSKVLDFGYTPGCYTQAILPMFDNSLPLNSLKVEFDARRGNTDGAFLIGALTDPSDDDTFEVIDTIVTSSNNSWNHITVYCNNYTGSGQYLAFRADNCGNSARLIDNLVIDYLPECLPISNLYVSDLTMEGATISWSGNADSYNVYVGGNIYNTTDTFIVINDLNASSSYSVSVRAICANDSSVMSEAISFNTSCGAITVTEETPWFEDFEGYTSSSFICWETPVTYTANNGTFPMVYRNYGDACHSGVNSAEFKGTECMLVLPEFSNDINTLRLSFWATATSVSTGHIQIGVITNVMDTSTFELVIADAGMPGPRGGSSAGNGNYMGPFDLNGATATSGRIALRYVDPTGTGLYPQSWNVDDFTVGLVPDCPSPVKTSVTATNIDGHNATISWTDNDPTHTAWIVYYKASTDSEWSTEPASSTTLILSNLTPETTYDVYVITDCGSTVDNPDATLTINFTTLIACPAPQDLTVSNIGMTSATVTWFSNADSYTIEYGEAGFTPGEGTSATVTDNTYDLTGMTSGTAYTVYITADCGADGTSQPASVNFNTNMCEVTDQCEYIFNLADSYGDGWNGNSITVQQNGITVATVGFSSGDSATVPVTLCDNQPTTLIWNTGSYASECSFEVLNSYGDVIYTSSGTPSGTLTTFTTSCTPITCPRPSSITVSNIGTTTAEVSWISTGTETAWNVEYKVNTDATWTVIPVTTNPYTLTGLTAGSSYDIRVQADCGGGDVSDYRESSFSTANCELADQCTYTFTLNDSYGDGWNGASLNVQQNGVTVATLSLSGSSATETVALCDNVSTSLVWNSGNYDSETSFSVSDPNGTEIFATTGTPSAGVLHTFTTDCSGSGPVFTEPTVATNAASDIMQTTATMNGTISNPSNVNVTPMGFEWKESSALSYTVVNVTGETLTHNLNGLTPSTQYTYRAFMTYNGLTYYGDVVTFTTLPEDTPEPCDVPSSLTASNITKESFDVSWNENVNVNSWNIRYRPQNGQWISATSSTNQYSVSGLAAETSYEVQVQADCGDNNLSEWSDLLTVTTLVDGLNSYLLNSIAIFPNPTNDYVMVQSSRFNVQSVEVIDVYGKVINTVNVVDNPTRINVSCLANGMYFVRVTTDAGSVTKTFVKK